MKQPIRTTLSARSLTLAWSDPMLRFGGNYVKVGARSPYCRSGTLKAVGDRKVQYHQGMIAWFEGQLIFTKMTDPGDSGAVIIDEQDNTVTGLNFAGNDYETVANPIYLNNWSFQGVFRSRENITIPVFTGTESPAIKGVVYETDDISVRANSLSNVNMLNEYSQESVGLIPFDVPSLTAGKLFLGIAIFQWETNPNIGQRFNQRWSKPVPAPIRPGVQVETIFLRNDCLGSGNLGPVFGDIYLCFG